MSSSSRRWTIFALVAAALAGIYQWAHQCPNLDKIRGSVVVITGSSSGIGAELAKQYGSYGAKLVLAARRQSELEKTAAVALEAGAQDVLVLPTDMGSAEQCKALIDRTVEKYGRIDTLILNHAAFDDGMFRSHKTAADLEWMKQQFNINVMSGAYAMQAALPHLEVSAGHIAVVSSASTKIAAPFHPGYVTSKKAIHGLFDTVRAELKLIGSRVSIGILVIGMIATPEVISDKALEPLATPVPACAAGMICAIQARWEEAYVPSWYAPWTALTYLHPAIAEVAMNNFYVFRVDRYVKAIEEGRAELAAVHAGADAKA